MVIKNITRLDRKLNYLAHVLPPIEYSTDGSNISLTKNLGTIRRTTGSTSEAATNFKNFLEARGALLQYIVNVLEVTDQYHPIERLDNIEPYQYILLSFPWGDSREREDYWTAIQTAYTSTL